MVSGEGEGASLRQNLRLGVEGVLGELVASCGDRISGGGKASSASVRSAGAVRGVTVAFASPPPELLLESLRRRERDALC